MNELERWVGRAEQHEDRIDATRLRALLATLDQDPSAVGEGSALPPLAVWTYFNVAAPWHALGPDGHPARGLFLPPVALPRRMADINALLDVAPPPLREALLVAFLDRLTRPHRRSGGRRDR